MKKNLLLWVLLLCCLGATHAQLVTVTSRIELPVTITGFYPILNQDGSELLYTSENYYGLNLYQIENKENHVISTEEGTGFKPCFQEAENKIYFQKTIRTNMR